MAKCCCGGFDVLVEEGTIIRTFGKWALRAGQGVIYVYFCPCCGEGAFDPPRGEMNREKALHFLRGELEYLDAAGLGIHVWREEFKKALDILSSPCACDFCFAEDKPFFTACKDCFAKLGRVLPAEEPQEEDSRTGGKE